MAWATNFASKLSERQHEGGGAQRRPCISSAQTSARQSPDAAHSAIIEVRRSCPP